jgi:hypothetical protein
MKDTMRHMLLSALAAMLLYACDDLTSIKTDSNDQVAGTGALYMLSDGNYSLNNSTLSVYDFSAKKLTADFFQEKNGRRLGDTGNDMQRYGSKLYVVVNGSSQLEVLDARTGKSLKQIPLINGSTARQPRAIAFWMDKAYVCSFDGTVARIDTASLEAEVFVEVGRNPDGIAASNNKLYVSNSGGLDYGSDLSYDRTVSVISTETFTEDKRIDVGPNPGRIKADNFGYVYVSVRGDYKTEPSRWVCIDTQTDAVSATYDFAVTNFDLSGDKAYFYSFDDATKQSTIGVFNLKSRTVETNAFIQDGTLLKTPYGITADPESGAVFITDAGDYISSGDVYCFSESGMLAYKLTNVGINPNTVLPVSDFKASNSAATDTTTSEGLYHVYDFTPAPGQFVGVYPAFTTGETVEQMRAKAEAKLKAGSLVSLGRFGGSLTFAFRTSVNNAEGTDFSILGNAFSNSAEPGIVEVSEDVNGNGLPDDAWYELAGSEYAKNTTKHGYKITYFKPEQKSDSVFFTDNADAYGYVTASYPFWQGDSIVCKGTLLPPNAAKNELGYWSSNSLPWGYADNQPNNSGLNSFDLDWAVNEDGTKAALSKINFIRVYTAVNQNAGWMGELSTEICGAENLHP